MKAGKMILFFVAGGLFGTGLAISGMTDPARVIGFLDLFGAWDPALLFVMAGAVGVYGLGMLMLRRMKNRDLKLPSPTPSPIDRQLIVGSAIFGVGWGLGGFCPGPAEEHGQVQPRRHQHQDCQPHRTLLRRPVQ